VSSRKPRSISAAASGLGVGDDLALVRCELRRHRLFECDRLRPRSRASTVHLDCPGRSTSFSALAYFSGQRISPPARGRAGSCASCLVHENRRNGTGDGCTSAATSPAKCAMSVMRIAPDLVGDAAERRRSRASAGTRYSRRRSASDDARAASARELLVVRGAGPTRARRTATTLKKRPEKLTGPAVREVPTVAQSSSPRSCPPGGELARSRRPCWPATPSAAARSRARRQRSPSPRRDPPSGLDLVDELATRP